MAKREKTVILTSVTKVPVTKELIVERMNRDPKWLYRGILAIYDRQTADEQASETTSHDNGIGFNGVDASFLSSLAKQVRNRGFLTPTQLTFARKKMAKYAGQLLRIAEGRA